MSIIIQIISVVIAVLILGNIDAPVLLQQVLHLANKGFRSQTVSG